MSDDKEARDVVMTIYFQDIFSFIYSNRESAEVSSNFFDLGYDVDDFKAEATIAIEVQILLRNFKNFKKIDVMKPYLFWLLGVYLVNDPIYSIMLR